MKISYVIQKLKYTAYRLYDTIHFGFCTYTVNIIVFSCNFHVHKPFLILYPQFYLRTRICIIVYITEPINVCSSIINVKNYIQVIPISKSYNRFEFCQVISVITFDNYSFISSNVIEVYQKYSLCNCSITFSQIMRLRKQLMKS